MNYELKTQNFKVKHGFTLIELLVVISIIAVLIASATASWRNAQMKGRDAKRKSDVKAVQQALENYLQTNGKYPSSNGGQIQCNTGSGVNADNSIKSWGNTFSCDPDGSGPQATINYMQQIPKDPVYQADVTKGYYYNNPSATPYNYVLSAYLENVNDSELTGLKCTFQAGRNWCVTNP